MTQAVIALVWAAAALLGTARADAQAQYSAAVEQWRPAVAEACAVHGCSTDYVLGVIDCESNGDPNALGAHGEVGLLQIKPWLWGHLVDAWNPYDSIVFAAQHLTAGDVWWECG